MDSAILNIPPPRPTCGARLMRVGVMSVIFLAGGVAGYCLGTIQWNPFDSAPVKVMSQPDKFTEILLAQLKRDLVLTDEQYPKVETILIRHHEGFDKIRKQTQPLFDKQMATLERDMQAVLTTTQWTRYKSQLDWMKNRGRRPPGSSRTPGKDGRPSFGSGQKFGPKPSEQNRTGSDPKSTGQGGVGPRPQMESSSPQGPSVSDGTKSVTPTTPGGDALHAKPKPDPATKQPGGN